MDSSQGKPAVAKRCHSTHQAQQRDKTREKLVFFFYSEIHACVFHACTHRHAWQRLGFSPAQVWHKKKKKKTKIPGQLEVFKQKKKIKK